MLAADDRFAAYFDDALSLHASVASSFARARTQLCYGERLRRVGSRRDARIQLRAAMETFERTGASLWEQRARSELRSSGETLRGRESHATEELTPHELQIALKVAEGKTNKEVGAALVLSHKTIEFHLSRVYRKLDLTSRADTTVCESGSRRNVPRLKRRGEDEWAHAPESWPPAGIPPVR